MTRTVPMESVPVVLLVFNRPEYTRRVLAQIRRAKPQRVLIVADGPRPDCPDDKEACLEVRRVIEKELDWRPEVVTNFSETNQGLRQRVVSGLTWAFNLVDEAIVLEDDCVPDTTFFRFCAELLDRYREDGRVAAISGDNFQSQPFACDASYYFSKYLHCWGWATWRRSWRQFDEGMQRWPSLRNAGWLSTVFDDPAHARFWTKLFDGTHRRELNSWAIAWQFSCWSQSLLSVLPRVNLVENIGIGPGATHTKGTETGLRISASEMEFPLRHPDQLVIDQKADEFTQRACFGGQFSPLTFSIAVPVLGQEQFLPTALKSLRAQEGPVRLSVLDATPGEGVQQILSGFQDMLSYRRHGPDGGQSAAIQEGWDRTDGEILGWLNADDYYFPDTLQQVRKIFADDDSLDVVYGDSIYVNEREQFLMYFPGAAEDLSVLPFHNCIAQPSCFVRRRTVERVGRLNRDLQYIMDWDLWCRILEGGGKFSYLRRPLSATRIHGGMKTLNRSKRRYAEISAHMRARHVGKVQHLKTLLAFYHYDRANSSTLTDRLVTYILTMVRDIGHVVSRPPAFWDEPLYGLERYTNRVQTSCEISLPWYGDRAPVRLVIQGNKPVPLSVRINAATSRRIEPVANHGRWMYTALLSDPVVSMYRMTLNPADDARDWRVRKLWLE